MALQTVLYQQDVFGNSNKDQYNLFGGGNLGRDTDLAEKFESCSFDFFQENIEENSPPFPTVEQSGQWALNAASEHEISAQKLPDSRSPMSNRSRRRCLRPKKNQEEIEHQRMAHIAVERNRRKQMNEYLSVLRDLVPEGYVQKGDQASIVGGAMNYVKELEQQLQFLDGQNHMNDQYYETGILSSSSFPFSEFFSFPQYSTTVTGSENAFTTRPITDLVSNSWTNRNRLAAADIEVTMVENHANLKVRTRKRPKQLTKMVSGLQSLRLTVLHLNVTTADQIVLYSISVKVENDCKLTSVDEIAGAVNKILREIQEEVAALMG